MYVILYISLVLELKTASNGLTYQELDEFKNIQEYLLTVIINNKNTSIHLWINLISLFIHGQSPVISH